MFSRLGAIWSARRILFLLIGRDLKVRYNTASLGWMWSLLEPLLMATVYWFVFTKIIERTFGSDPYIVFLLAAMLPWMWASAIIGGSPRALLSQSKLVRSTNIPREIWVLREVGSKGVEFLFGIPILIGFMVVLGVGVSPYVLAVPLGVLILLLLLSGIALALSSISVLYRDVRQLTRVVTRLMFYFSPILYGVQDVAGRLPETVARFYMLNPFAGIIDLFRAAMFPDDFHGWWPVAWAGFVAVAVFVLGLRTFARLERSVLKEL